MKKSFLITVVLSVLFMGVISAQGADLKIGHVDLSKALNDSDRGKKAAKIMEDMINDKKSILIKKENEIKELEEEMKRQSSILTPESMKEKREHLDNLYKNYKRNGKDFQEEIQKKEAELTHKIQKDLLEIVKKIGKEEGYTMIFESGTGGILCAREEFDITDKVVKKYNETSDAEK
ncbi:MAG: OmpH family outer membrane protein [Candidatus Mariimomonas ferrooxydans]